MTTETNLVEVQIPFDGFYESIWSGLIDSEEESSLSHIYEENEVNGKYQSLFADVLWCKIDYSEARLSICKEYVSGYAEFLAEKLGAPVVLEFSIMTSPKEYNFTTDRLFVKVELATMQKILALPEVQKELPAMLIRNHKSRSGFSSFYSHIMGEGQWAKPNSEWDHNQWNTVLDCLFVDDETRNDFTMGAYEYMSGNGTVNLNIESIYDAWLIEHEAETGLDNEYLDKIKAAINALLKPEWQDNFLVMDTLLQDVTKETEELELNYLHTLSGNYEKLDITALVNPE